MNREKFPAAHSRGHDKTERSRGEADRANSRTGNRKDFEGPQFSLWWEETKDRIIEPVCGWSEIKGL